MSLVKANLVNAIKTSIQNEVNRCTINGEFKPEMFDITVYLDTIYKYIRDNADIKVNYVGAIPGTPPTPDPQNGVHTLKVSKVGNEVLREAVINAQRSITSFPPTPWWTALIASLLITSETSDSKITLNPITPQAVSTKIWSQSDFKVGEEYMSDFTRIWEVYVDEIIKAVTSAVYTGTAITTSISGGTGFSTLMSIT